MTKAQERAARIEADKQAKYVAKVRRLLGHIVGAKPSEDSLISAYKAGVTAEDQAAVIASQEPVGAAVHALKAAAVERAGKSATEHAERVMKDMAANGWDLTLAAPYPTFHSPGSREMKEAARAKHSLYASLTKSADPNRCRRPGDQDIRVRDDEGISRYVAQCETLAALQYDAFIVKLVQKVGPVISAVLDGDHVWHHSILRVAKREGNETYGEAWKTQQIVNYSKLGTPFHQWPTRKLK